MSAADKDARGGHRGSRAAADVDPPTHASSAAAPFRVLRQMSTVAQRQAHLWVAGLIIRALGHDHTEKELHDAIVAIAKRHNMVGMGQTDWALYGPCTQPGCAAAQGKPCLYLRQNVEPGVGSRRALARPHPGRPLAVPP